MTIRTFWLSVIASILLAGPTEVLNSWANATMMSAVAPAAYSAPPKTVSISPVRSTIRRKMAKAPVKVQRVTSL